MKLLNIVVDDYNDDDHDYDRINAFILPSSVVIVHVTFLFYANICIL